MADRAMKLTTKLPQGDANGLGDPEVIRRVMADPAQLRVGIVIYNVPKTEHDNVTGDEVGKVEILRIEPILDDTKGDATALERLLTRAFERRTGQTTLDAGLEDDVRAAFNGINLIDMEAEELFGRHEAGGEESDDGNRRDDE